MQVWDNGKGQRLDRQEYLLPREFHDQTLTSVTLTDTGNEGNGVNGSRAVPAALTVSSCDTYPTEGIGVTSSPILYHSQEQLYSQEISLTNNGTAPVLGPLFFIAEDLPAGVTLANQAGTAACLSPIGSGYVVPLEPEQSLAPDTSLRFLLWFRDPSAAVITYTGLPARGGKPGATP